MKKIKKVMENVVIKGTADNIYLSSFSMAGKTGTAKKFDKLNVVQTSKHSKTYFCGFS